MKINKHLLSLPPLILLSLILCFMGYALYGHLFPPGGELDDRFMGGVFCSAVAVYFYKCNVLLIRLLVQK